MTAFRCARAYGIPTILDVDVTAEKPTLEVLSLTDFPIFSEAALEEFTRRSRVFDQLRHAMELGLPYCGVTLGARGYRWMRQGGDVCQQCAANIRCIDTTGAGDAFHGAFAWARTFSHHDQYCATVATSVAALKCGRLGARSGLPTVDELDDFMAKEFGERLPGGILLQSGPIRGARVTSPLVERSRCVAGQAAE